MGIFDRVRKKSAASSKEAKVPQPVRKSKKSSSAEEAVVAKPTSTRKMDLLIMPRMSEKAAGLTSRGVYVFNVPLQANKIEVRKAVEERYQTKVASVRTVRGIGKRVTRGRIHGQRSAWKKAIVTLQSDQKLDLYEGV
jgi:large subunit ribosomal protein L23